MDPVSHVIFGRTLIALDRHGRLGTGAIAAAILGALSPDIDVIAVWRGWDVYLRIHEIGTHSIVGSLVLGSAAGTLVYVLMMNRGARYTAMALAGSAGALSHVAFDIVSGASIRLAWPFLQRRVSLPLVAMADPWLIAICAAGALGLWALRRRAFIVATTVPQWRAVTGDDAIVHHVVEASWSSLTEWNVSDRTPVALRKWRVDASGTHEPLFSIPLRVDSPLVEASRSFDTVQNFLRVHDLGFPVTTPLEDGTQVLWSDIRYCWSRTECALWFGGVFDRHGRPVRQVVHVGQWQQTRPLSP
jgi:membrane-bound metal-dependent hydrolase YbcI (DUF457 family)